ncbi:predicted protein, putative [Babesia bigemina]|uniref:MACPF domain-containing protein n=1 Tax=Babesia bigemina TaxID=5866 RepID=A0A061D6F7_BABBI|nr:predicted protein, putative [Babesia bigemina]CDR96266.1 predicted protein, putative [Babesia bigemina]|eukprot:XP_012768452.1 predicted protein, putative [Babesia bigemina]
MNKTINRLSWVYVLPSLIFFSVRTARVGEGEVRRKERFPVSLEKQLEIFKDTNKTPKNIEYVGCGYDMYNGTSIDDRTGFSLKNYRAPVLDKYYTGESEGNQLEGLGIWVANEFQCDLSNELSSVDTKQNLMSLISSKTSDGYSNIFSSSTSETTKDDDILNKLKRSRSIIVRKYHCTVYSAGININDIWKNSTRFNGIVKRLVDTCKGGFKEVECPIDRLKKNIYDEGCEGCIASWMRFFADFGTHATQHVTMGGTYRRFNNAMDKQASRKSKKSEVTITTSSSWFGLSNSRQESTKENEFMHSRDDEENDVVQYTVGPEPKDEFMTPDSFEDWVRKVALNPVPIDVEFISLSELMPDDETRKLFKEALRYYAKLRGVDKNDTHITNGALRSSILQLVSHAVNMIYRVRLWSFIVLQLQESTLVAINDPDKVGKDVCKGESKIIFGFGVNLNEKRQILQLKPCYPGLNACILDLNQDVVSTFVIALCGEMQFYDFTQKLTKGSSDKSTYNEVVCPKDTVVVFGVIIRFGYPMMIRECPKGIRSCGDRNLGPNGLIWVACLPKNTFGINLYSTTAGVLGAGEKLPCDSSSKVVNGFTILSTRDNKNVRVAACPKYEVACHAPSQNEASVGSYIFCVK